MKNWLRNIVLFLLPIILAVVAVFAMPVSRKYAYNFIAKGGCQARPPWIYKQIFTDTANIDIAFIGTSHTMGAVDDSLIEQQIREGLGLQLNCKNISFCGFGRNFDYVVVKDLLENKRPKIVVLEVRENESQLGHLSFAYAATANDVIMAPMAFNKTYLPDIYKSLLFRLQYIREQITGEDGKRMVDISPSKYGYNPNDITANANDLDLAFNKMMLSNKRKNEAVERLFSKYPMAYVNKIAMAVKANGVQFVFVYLPAYTHQTTSSDIIHTYSTLGKVILADSITLADKSNWTDAEHLNIKGSKIVSKQIADNLVQILSQ